MHEAHLMENLIRQIGEIAEAEHARRVTGVSLADLGRAYERGVYALLSRNKAARAKELAMGRPLDVVYSPRWNTFRGHTNLEVLVHDFRCGE